MVQFSTGIYFMRVVTINSRNDVLFTLKKTAEVKKTCSSKGSSVSGNIWLQTRHFGSVSHFVNYCSVLNILYNALRNKNLIPTRNM